jgi:tetratricopeptide (TPR) repeat protein
VNADGEGWTLLDAANVSLYAGEYEDAIDNARDALEVFRDVLRSINNILVDSGIETEQILDTQLLQEAIDRSRDRIAQLRALIDDGHELEGNLTDAEDYLDVAQTALDAGELEDAKDALIEANSIISDVCTELREIAKGLNPGRVQSYLVHAQQYRERFRGIFGQAADEDIDIDAVVQALGYVDEEDFMAQLQEMIQNAQDANDINHAIKELKDFSKMAKKMDNAITEEFGNHGNGNGQGNGNGNGKGKGNMGGGNSP